MLQMANVVKAICHDSAIKYKNAPIPWIWFNMSPPFHKNHITGQKRIGNNLGCSQEVAIHLECIPKHDVKVSANDLWHLLTVRPQSACKCTHCLCIKEGNILQSSQVQLNLVWQNKMHHPTWNLLPLSFFPIQPWTTHHFKPTLMRERARNWWQATKNIAKLPTFHICHQLCTSSPGMKVIPYISSPIYTTGQHAEGGQPKYLIKEGGKQLLSHSPHLPQSNSQPLHKHSTYHAWPKWNPTATSSQMDNSFPMGHLE